MLEQLEETYGFLAVMGYHTVLFLVTNVPGML